MKKLLLISNNGLGFYNFKKELIIELLSHGYEVHFAVPNYEKLFQLEEMGAIYHKLEIDRRGLNPIKDLSFIKQLNGVISKVKPNLIILHTIKPNIYGSSLSKLKGIPYINNITGLGSALQTESRLAKVLRFMYRKTLNKSKGIFFENQGNLEYFKKLKIGCDINYKLVNGAGVNTEYFKTMGELSFATRHLKEKKNKIKFLFIGRIMKDKGIIEYLEMSKTISSSTGNVEFQILGDYDEISLKDMVEDYVKRGYVKYLGVSSDTRIEMAQADCIVLPSYHEGMSNVLLEGASMEIPLITTNVPGCREAVDCMKTGILCEAKNVDSLTNAVKTFLDLSDQQRMEMGLKGREKMVKEFDRNIVIKKYIDCIEEVL